MIRDRGRNAARGPGGRPSAIIARAGRVQLDERDPTPSNRPSVGFTRADRLLHRL